MRNPRTATKSSPHSLQLEKARMQQRRPKAAKNKWFLKIILKNDLYQLYPPFGMKIR